MRVALPFVSLLLAASASAQDDNGVTCVDGLYLIVARGTGEPEGTGTMGVLADDVAERVQDSEVVGLDYPATLADPIYIDSLQDGASELKVTIARYSDNCPDGKIAVLGYSQGAQVSLNALCGGAGTFQGDLEPVSSSIIESSVVAVVLFGDPSYNQNATYNEGTSDNSGIFARKDIEGCEAFASRIRSYCDKGDTYCDRGNIQDVHGSYIETYGDDVVDFIVSRFEGDADDSTTTITTTATQTSTASSTEETESSSTTTGEDEPTGTDEEAAEPTETDNGAAGLAVFGGAWWVSLAAVAAWQVL